MHSSSSNGGRRRLRPLPPLLAVAAAAVATVAKALVGAVQYTRRRADAALCEEVTVGEEGNVLCTTASIHTPAHVWKRQHLNTHTRARKDI